ncbi:hypothetical protein RclHR1_01580018 [Rhizophagus clarus]|uniref:HMG box domain-containing protein n=1 Tax=Rhizophagus clarus TaxID=94130 RepID=A0A2Z6QG40_9GLOM|nr:hypothetical protein RclHR1_01580018 [Rhizophagus clarus]GES78634.1 hypothetical protein GLOIN_2v1473758 [Rhizophagus clarus]
MVNFEEQRRMPQENIEQNFEEQRRRTLRENIERNFEEQRRALLENIEQNFEEQRRALLENIEQNRLEIFPPPVMDPVITLNRLSYVNRRSPRIKKTTGCGILKYYINLRGRVINCTEAVINMVTSEIWKSATPAEKREYVSLSRHVNMLIAGQHNI